MTVIPSSLRCQTMAARTTPLNASMSKSQGAQVEWLMHTSVPNAQMTPGLRLHRFLHRRSSSSRRSKQRLHRSTGSWALWVVPNKMINFHIPHIPHIIAIFTFAAAATKCKYSALTSHQHQMGEELSGLDGIRARKGTRSGSKKKKKKKKNPQCRFLSSCFS